MKNRQQKYLITGDLGGTNLRLALVNLEGKIVKTLKQPTGNHRSPDKIVNRLAHCIRLLSKQTSIFTLDSICLGVPGIVSASQGQVYSSPHFPEWKNFALVKKLQAKLKLKVHIDNDAHQIALGESGFGAAKDWSDFLMVTLGTGIGGALVINRKIYSGTRGFAGELGHLNINPLGRNCGCGSRGCWETVVSGSGIKQSLEELSLTQNQVKPWLRGQPETLVQRVALKAKKHHPLAVELFHDFGQNLGLGLASIVNITGIQNIVLGGSISKASDLFLKPAIKEMRKRTYAEMSRGVKIRLAQLGDKAGLLGGILAFQNLQITK